MKRTLSFWILGAVIAGSGLLAGPLGVRAQQVGDTLFTPRLGPPAYAAGTGPRVLLDGAHHNFHTVDGRFAPFARVLRQDGFRVSASTQTFTAELLQSADVLVIANALNERNTSDWSLPTPSAFTPAEIAAVRDWVEGGGSLMLIADHMPFPGAAEDLAAAFGFRFHNGFAVDTLCRQCAMPFRRIGQSEGNGGTVEAHPITDAPGAAIDSVFSFTGQAFELPADAEPVLVVGSDVVLLLPTEAWRFTEETPRRPAAGLSQGATLRYGRGRVAVFGEAAMFSAQRAGPDGSVLMGMNAPQASQNAQFLVNTVRWLVGRPDR